MKIFPALVRSGITFLLFIIFASVGVTPAASQTAVTKVVVTSVNANEAFPEVEVQVKAVDAEGAFILGLTPDKFSIREDGELLPISEVTNASLPLNVRLVFVIDELVIAPRLAAVREAIQSFAENQMQAGYFVEVLAAGENGKTQVIVPLTSNPDEVVNGIQEANYNPASASSTDLLDAVNQGLTELSALNENIEGINRIVVFSLSIIDQIDLNVTIERAAELAIPIHTVLLGSEDAAGALGRLARETKAGNGAILPENLNDVFGALNDQRDQDQYLISYRSQADQPGEHELVVTINSLASNDVSFTIDNLEPPLIQITDPAAGTVIKRAEQTVAVEVNWPDGHPREIVLEKTALVVDGKSLGPATVIRDNGKDPVILEFTLDLREEQIPGENLISVVVEAEDELGLKGRSEPLSVTVDYVQIVTCPSFVFDYIPALCSNLNLILPLASLLVAIAALILVVVFLRRNPQVQQKVKERLGTMMTSVGGGERLATRIVTEADAAKASLIVLEGSPGGRQTHFPLNKTTTIGRSSEHAELALQGDKESSPISRLHCTVLEKDGVFELRDESSANGTHLNDVRLPQGKAHKLNNGDTIELAKVRDGGVKFKFETAEKPKPLKTRIVGPETPVDEKVTPEGYTPTIPPESKKAEEKITPEGYTPTMPPESKKKESDEKIDPDGYTPTNPMT